MTKRGTLMTYKTIVTDYALKAKKMADEIEKVINTKKKLASTTILSLLTRLESKNFVEVTKQGKLNLYTPLVSQSDYQAHESQSVLEKLYGNSLKKFVELSC